MGVRTTDDFFQVVANNELLAKERLAAAREATKDLVEPVMVARKLVDRGLLTRWTASQILAGKQPLKIGKYRLLDLVDSTPWGPVYRAEHVQLKREAVVKTLARRKDVTKKDVSQFLQEARRLSILDHPNLTHLYDIDQEEHFYYLAMEYCEGMDLARKVDQEGPLAAGQAAHLTSQAAKGLDHAHLKKIFHHAITPSRLVANDRGNLKLLDTGVAQLETSEETAVDDVKSAMPSMEYMAPEQLTQRDTIDQRADIYSLGCTLFFLLAGKPPFEKDEALAQFELRMEGKPPDVRQLQSDVPRELAAICSKMMAGRPEDRYQSAAEVASELDAWLASGVAIPNPAVVVSQKATTAPQPAEDEVLLEAWDEPSDDQDDTAESQFYTNRWLIIGGATAVLLLCVVAAFFVGGSDPGDDPDSQGSSSSQRQSRDQRQTKRPAADADFDFPTPGAYVGSAKDDNSAKEVNGAKKVESAKQNVKKTPISKKSNVQAKAKGPKKSGAGTAPSPAAAGPAGQPLAYWRFEGGNPDAYVKNLKQIGFPAAVADSSPNGNSLYCLRPSVAPKHALDVPPTKLRVGETVEQNASSLDDTQPPGGGETARYLISDSQRAKAKLDVEGHPLDLWTVEASFRLANSEGVQTLVCKNGRPPEAPKPPFKLQFDGNRKNLSVAVIDRSGQQRTVASRPDFAIAVGQWVHVAVVGNGKELQIYGRPSGTTPYQMLGKTEMSGGLAAGSGRWTVGAALDDQLATEDALAMIDEIRISTGALQPKDFLFAPEVVAEVPKPQISNKTPTPSPKAGRDAAKGRKLANTPFVELSPLTLPALPAPDFTDALPLGSVYFANVKDFQPSLVGGDGGHGAQGTFDLGPSVADADVQQWDFRFTAAAGGKPTPIARLRLVDYDLSMYWLDAAAEVAAADHLRNCLLNFKVKDKSKRFALRDVAEVQPIGFSFARSRRRDSAIIVVSPPSEERIRVDIRLPADVFGDSTFDPAGPLAINDGETAAKLGEQQMVTMRLATIWKPPELGLNVRLYYQADPESDKLTQFTAKNINSALANVVSRLEGVKRDLAALEKKKEYDAKKKLARDKKLKGQEKREHDALRRRFPNFEGAKLDAALKRGQAFIEKLAPVSLRYTELADFGKTLQLPAEESGAFIQLRVFTTVGDSEVDLVRTIGWSEQ